MCVYNKKNMCIYVCVWGCLDKYISVVTWPPQTKIPGSAPVQREILWNAKKGRNPFETKIYNKWLIP